MNVKEIKDNPEAQRRAEKLRFEYKEKVMQGELGLKRQKLVKMGTKPGQLTLDDFKTR